MHANPYIVVWMSRIEDSISELSLDTKPALSPRPELMFHEVLFVLRDVLPFKCYRTAQTWSACVCHCEYFITLS